MRVVFVENQDSFSWNVAETLPVPRARLTWVTPGRDDVVAALDGAGVVVVGPGPKDPHRAGLVDVVRVAAQRKLPLLGICLGHQALGLAFGAQLERVTPCHGKVSRVVFQPSRLFPGITGEHGVMRYHSLALARVVAPLRVVATTADALVMALEHETLPMASLQFHPDSFASPSGPGMVRAFFDAVGAS